MSRSARPPAALPALAIVAAAIALIVPTYSTFSQTWDEPVHVAAGMEWLDRGTFRYEPLTPPLARVAAALGPWLDGARSHGLADIWEEGNAILYGQDRYVRTLSLARLGTLPFFVLACFVVWRGARRRFGERAGLAALLLFATLPPVLGHAGLAATDFALAATYALAFEALVAWLDSPRPGTGAWLGAAAALAALTKFSALPFLALACVLLVVLRLVLADRAAPSAAPRPSGRLSSLALAALVGAAVVWAGYRFSVDPLVPATHQPHPALDRRVGASGALHDLAYRVVEADVFPAIGFARGLRAVPGRNTRGHKAYLDGEIRLGGRWQYFLRALEVKTPLPFLALGLCGLVALATDRNRRRDWIAWAPLAGALAVLIVGMTGNLNIGVRLVLGVYPGLAMLAGCGAVCLFRSSRVGAAAAVLLVAAQVVGTWRERPDFLASFNALAGPRPERVLVDSDLDWGQDLFRLRDTLRARGVDSLALEYSGTADPGRHGLPPFRTFGPGTRPSGWVAISLYRLYEGRPKDPPPLALGYRWLERERPVARIGRSILLYRLAPAPAPTP